jgi:hypothetical protein
LRGGGVKGLTRDPKFKIQWKQVVNDRAAKFLNAFYIILQYDTKILSRLSTYFTDRFNNS